MCAEDRGRFNGLLKGCIQEFGCSFEDVVLNHPVLYGDFMIPRADHRVYKLIQDNNKVSSSNQCEHISRYFVHDSDCGWFLWEAHFPNQSLTPNDIVQLMKVMQEYMEDYNQSSPTRMQLVLFREAMEHVCRICRILRQPLGNALLLGVDGCGRQSLTKLASYM